MTPAAARAQEMAAYSQALLAPYVRRLEEQAEELGRVRNELEHLQAERDAARARIAELEAPPADEPQTQNGAPSWPERRPWYKRLVWG
jgi:hypothetical protein